MSQEATTPLAATKLAVHVPGRTLVEALDVDFDSGEFVAVLGKNGAGKTLTMLTLAGLRAPSAGTVSLFGEDLVKLPRTAVAKRLSLMPQTVDDIFPATVLDTVLIGRHPHIAALQWESASDRDIAVAKLGMMGIGDLEDRDILTLSGGERRRLAVAQLLAQEADVCLLDEPTNHLDPQHQLDVMDVLRAGANGGATIVANLHDVNLAARYADRCLVLYGDGRWELGPTAQILTPARLASVYGVEMDAVAWGSRTLFVAARRVADHSPPA